MASDGPTGSTSSLRRTHRGLALRHLLVEGEASRVQLADRLGLSQMAASRIVRDLIDAGLVEEAGPSLREAGPGRHQTMLRMDRHGVFAAGIVLAAHPTEVMIVDAIGSPIARRSIAIGSIHDGAAAAEGLAHALNDLIDEHGLPRNRIAGIGVSVAAHLAQDRRHVLGSSFLGWSPFDLVTPIEKITGLPVVADNIANSLALAETSVGVAKAMSDVILVRASTLLGASIVQGGRIVRGETQRAGRLGHMRHRRTGLTCSCGKPDCLNCSASGWSLLCGLGKIRGTRYRLEDIRRYSQAIETLIEHHGDAQTLRRRDREMNKAGAALAEALHALNLFLEPEAIVVDGPLSRAHAYMDGIRARLSTLGESGQETLGRLRRGEIRAVRAAAILALLGRVYSSELDFEALRSSSSVLPGAQRSRGPR